MRKSRYSKAIRDQKKDFSLKDSTGSAKFPEDEKKSSFIDTMGDWFINMWSSLF